MKNNEKNQKTLTHRAVHSTPWFGPVSLLQYKKTNTLGLEFQSYQFLFTTIMFSYTCQPFATGRLMTIFHMTQPIKLKTEVELQGPQRP